MANALEIVDPTTGEVLDRDDVDGLLSAYLRIRDRSQALYVVELQIREAVAEKAQGDGKTLRVRGERLRCEVMLPGDNWRQSVLKEFAERFGTLARDWLRVATYAVNMREWKKVLNESGPEEFEAAKKMLSGACEKSTSPPTIKVEFLDTKPDEDAF